MNPLEPGLSLLSKLASIDVHADEMLCPTGHPVDKHALNSVLLDPEVTEWLYEMTRRGFAPVKR